ncbi:MAG: hypothetical protein ACJ795_13865 [Ktedonobacteraceae bacterium]|jgi:hypothetical protein
MATQTTTTKPTSQGICNFCKGEFDKRKMTQHLKSCKQRKANNANADAAPEEKTRWYHLLVEGRYLPMYWMHLEMPTDATLADLDDFLRDIWLECCGHLSEFRIGKASYSSSNDQMYWPEGAGTSEDGEDEEEGEEDTETELNADEIVELSPLEAAEVLLELVSAEFQENLADVPASAIEAKLADILVNKLGVSLSPELESHLGRLAIFLQLGSIMERDAPQEYDMDFTLGEVLKVGQKFNHEYDFGSTTELSLKVLAEREGAYIKDEDGDLVGVIPMARNEPPVIPCRVCGKPATKVIGGYYSAWDGALCDTCPVGDDEAEMMLPVVNSPRVGVCGYDGGEEIVWDEVEDEDEEDEEE